MVLAISASLVLAAFAIWFGDLNQDEGWYLYASRLVSEGRFPYRDFFFTQGPTLPFVYGWAYSLWSEAGVLGGRIFTACIGFLSALMAGWLAARSVARDRAPAAGVAAFAMCACNLYHVYFTVIPKTYALASLLLTASFLLLSFCSASRRSLALAFAAGMLAAFAGGTRVSLLFALPPTALALLFYRRHLGYAWFFFGAGAVLGVALVFGWALIAAPDEFVFSQTFHVGRGGRNLMFVAGSLSRTVRAYTALFALLLFALCARFAGAGKGEGDRTGTAFHRNMWMLAAGTVALVQLASPHPYDDYQVPVMGLVAAGVVSFALDAPFARKPALWTGFAAVVLTCMVSFGSPMLQDWFVVRQDRFWTVMTKGGAMSNLRDAAKKINAISPKGDVLLTQDAYLAVATGKRLPHGMEMGPFSFFPELSDAEAEKNHVLNGALLERALKTVPAAVCAFSDYSWAIRSPAMDPVSEKEREVYLDLIGTRFKPECKIPDFGQNHTLLTICGRKDDN